MHTLGLPPHFWDGTGGALIGGILSFAAAMVVLFATRAADLQRMRLDAAIRSARDLSPRVRKIEQAAEALLQSPHQTTRISTLMERLDAASVDLLGFSEDLPRKHPGMTRAELRDANQAAFWLGSDAPVFVAELFERAQVDKDPIVWIQDLKGEDVLKSAEVAREIRFQAAELGMALVEVRGLSGNSPWANLKLRYRRMRNRLRQWFHPTTPPPQAPIKPEQPEESPGQAQDQQPTPP